MAKLTKVAQRIFGIDAGVDQIGKFGSLFAGSAASTTDPEEAQSLSNWLTGWFDAVIGGNAPAIEDMNAVHFVQTYQLAYLMQQGVAEWDADTIYFIGSIVNDSGTLYRSIQDDNEGNSVSDTAFWRPFSTEATGTGKDFWGTALPAGYVWASGKTIGNASSNATERANADTEELFTLLWNAYSNTLLPIYTSGGVASIRGASAAADFAANKALSVIDKRGRVSVGKDDLGGTAASRITTAGSGIDGVTLGESGGEQNHTLSLAELPSHNHGGGDHSHTYSRPAGSGGPTGAGSGGFGDSFSTGVSGDIINTEGGDDAHQNTQPSIICNYIIKL